MHWIQTKPIAVYVDTDQRLASHEQVELVCLGIGLAFRGIWIAQFPGNYRDVPDYIMNSPYEFAEYERLSNMIDTLISGFRSLYVMSFAPLSGHLPDHLQGFHTDVKRHRLFNLAQQLPHQVIRPVL